MAQTPKSKLKTTKYKQTPKPPRSHFPDAPNPYAFNLQPSGSDLNYPTNTLTASKKKNQKKINSPNIIKFSEKKFPKRPIIPNHQSSTTSTLTLRPIPSPLQCEQTRLPDVRLPPTSGAPTNHSAPSRVYMADCVSRAPC